MRTLLAISLILILVACGSQPMVTKTEPPSEQTHIRTQVEEMLLATPEPVSRLASNAPKAADAGHGDIPDETKPSTKPSIHPSVSPPAKPTSKDQPTPSPLIPAVSKPLMVIAQPTLTPTSTSKPTSAPAKSTAPTPTPTPTLESTPPPTPMPVPTPTPTPLLTPTPKPVTDLMLNFPFNGSAAEASETFASSGEPPEIHEDRFGRQNHAASFNGVNHGIKLFDASLEVSDDFTVMAWLKAESPHEVDQQSVFGSSGFTGQKYLIFPAYGPNHCVPVRECGIAGVGISVGNNGLSVYEHSQDYMPALLTHEFSLSDWKHIAVVYRQGRPSLYIDGVLVKTGIKSSRTRSFLSFDSGKSVTTIGGHVEEGPRSYAYGRYHGLVDDLLVFRRSLSAEEILAQSEPGS